MGGWGVEKFKNFEKSYKNNEKKTSKNISKKKKKTKKNQYFWQKIKTWQKWQKIAKKWKNGKKHKNIKKLLWKFWCLPMYSNVRKPWATDRHTVFPQVCPCDIAPTWRQKQMDILRSWGLGSLSSFCPVFGYVRRKTSNSIPFSTFPLHFSFILRNPAAFTTPSMVMIRMLPVRAWCPRYRPTYNLGWIPLATALALPSTSRASHFSRQAISPSPRKTNSTTGDANNVAVLRATIDGYPLLCNIALRYTNRRNKDTNHDGA